VERRLLHEADGRYDLLLVPHHGSETSSHAAFLRATRPRVAVATAALGNRFGFPRDTVRARYEEAGSRFWSTGDCGALRFALHADGRLEAWSARKLRPGIWRWPPVSDCPNESAEP
jgi:competence protein ComEC